MANKIAFIHDPLIATGPRGRIRADSLRVEQTGETNKDVVATFTGNVQVTFTPEDKSNTK